ncbi:3-hydroxyacyl-CoA dehydrogenase [Cryobacterium frigoriphilum]|uniref:3-hydroxyacyl-CoA dehydrogenase n=1 Tax=Cryobacterium frigoriphilum TaxID=1259150 RepID=A0A4R9A005_9MICO|nr:3-hydroxyacyl-CoA dehydrogenase NAD-binding domain-containing protein [Cryobacterium frigoriphilum]TFD49646.1 3-hydroxyacyl-CoA dehydrogenase [Cryobacterium frigoriphilum]
MKSAVNSRHTPTRVSLGIRTLGAHRIAVITFEAAPGALVTWTPGALTELAAVVRSIDTSTVSAVAFIGSGSAFGAGADLAGFQQAATPADGEDIAREGFAAFAGITGLAVPTFAFLNGTAVGGALELALRADYRTVAAGTRAIGLPEASLGLLPGWGGLASLSTLIGAAATAEIAIVRSLAGRHLTAVESQNFGVTDAVIADADFLTASLTWAVDVLDGREPPALAIAAGSWSADAVRATVAKRIPTTLPAVEAIITLLTEWQTRSAGPSDVGNRTLARLAVGGDPIEADTVALFGALLHTDECRASIYAFFTLQAARKRSRPAGGDREGTAESAASPAPTRVGVIGGGLMATQLAVLFATKLDAPTHLTEVTPERADLALERVSAQLDRAAARGSLPPERRDRIAAHITASADPTDQTGSTLVIEAVFEDLTVKQQVWASVESVVPLDTILLTNTSSLSIAEQGAELLRPERLIGLHFFNPVAVLPLIEIVRAAHTSPDVIDAAFHLAGSLGKTAVLVADTPGFVVNRLLTRLFSDSLALIDTGTDARVVDTALVGDGLPMTALTLLDYIGPAVQLHIFETMHAAFPDRFTVSPSLARIVEQKLSGYLTTTGGLTPEAQAIVDGVAAASAAEATTPATTPATTAPTTAAGPALTSAAVRDLLLGGLADETARMLAEGTVATAADIDACMMLGANYPHHTGGLTPLLDRSGASRAQTGSTFHSPGVASAPRIPEQAVAR